MFVRIGVQGGITMAYMVFKVGAQRVSCTVYDGEQPKERSGFDVLGADEQIVAKMKRLIKLYGAFYTLKSVCVLTENGDFKEKTLQKLPVTVGKFSAEDTVKNTCQMYDTNN